MPPGAYAITEASVDIRPGVIFFLRQRNASADRRQRPASPVHPYYLVYIHDDGAIRFGCGSAQQILGVFDSATMGKTSAITDLCDRFDSETDQGRDMSRYDRLLNDVVSHIRQSHTGSQIRQLRMGGARDFKLTPAPETPDSADDFDLVTWLVIKESE